MTNWIQGYYGEPLYIGDIQPQDVDDRTIARVLSRKCRFGGMCSSFYSVAQHSILVAEPFRGTDLYLPALLHDAHEVYTGMGDMPRPVKEWLRQYTLMVDGLAAQADAAIAVHYGFAPQKFHDDAIKQEDNRLLATEVRDLMCRPQIPWTEHLPSPRENLIIPMLPDDAYYAFMHALRVIPTCS